MNRSSARLLVVDDSSSMRMCLCYLLRQLGFVHIDEAVNGVAALGLYKRTAYDLVIADWYMPHLDGVGLLSAIRNGTERQHTPVLLLTGTESHGNLHEAVEAGATGFVPKPFFNPSLAEQVTKLISLIDEEPNWEEFEESEPIRAHA